MSRKTESHLHREADEIGCAGLISGIARNLYTHRACHAAESQKHDGPFYCPACHSDAVIHKCVERVDHFAHVARLTPILRSQESDLHDSCKREICSLLSKRFPSGKWDIERPIPEKKEFRIPALRPDISGRIHNQRVAIEVQASALTVNKIVKRSAAYCQRGIALLWLVPLREPLGQQEFRPRLFERYLHSIYFGRTYYWWAGQGLTLKPVHYSPATRHVEYREWYENGTLESGGGYDTEYKIIKSPLYGRDVQIDTDFISETRHEFTPDNERKAVPECVIWRDRLPSWWGERQ